MAFAFLFPGQGSQSLQMMDSFVDESIVKETFVEASNILDEDFWGMLQDDNTQRIDATVNTQPLMLTAGYAVYRLWGQTHGQTPAIMAGHSLGEYTALVAAGALSFKDALQLVRLRAQAMQVAVPAGSGAMAAILNLADESICEACSEASSHDEQVEVANFNSPGQVVIAGHKAAVERAMALCKEKGAKRAILLSVSVPSHCSLMKPAAEQLAEALKMVTLHRPAVPVVQNADVKSYTDPTAIKDALVRQLYESVQWTRTIQYLIEHAIVNMAECGPGKVLTGLVRRIDTQAQCVSLVDVATLNKAVTDLR